MALVVDLLFRELNAFCLNGGGFIDNSTAIFGRFDQYLICKML